MSDIATLLLALAATCIASLAVAGRATIFP